ncbi:MAG: DUF3006 domain-containing protein [Nitriliruptoraceae bacterium]
MIGHDRAVVDAIVDGTTARILVGPEELPWDVPVEALPQGASEGTWLVIDVPQAIVRIDEELTSQRASDLRDRLSQLRNRSSGRFDNQRD